MGSKLGEWSFVGGILVAVVVALFSSNISGEIKGWLILLLVVLGLLVGFLNITEKETTPFLVAVVALLATGTAGTTLSLIPVIGMYLQPIVMNIAVFVTPAAIVVALKAIQSLAKD